MTPADITFCLIQSELHWEDKSRNLEMFSEKIKGLKKQANIILLPEMFSTGFSMNAEKLAENMEGETIGWMRKTARESEKVICGSIIISEGGKFYNRLVWMWPDGSLTCYDKKHLFRMAGEDKHFNAGESNITVEYMGWKIRPLICYDLRFPVWSRNKYASGGKGLKADYDILLYVANWPSVRSLAWDVLLRARAVENQAYCIGLNRVGVDGTGKEYIGRSAAVDPKGEYILEPTASNESEYYVTFDYNSLADFREKFPQGLDADDFSLTK